MSRSTPTINLDKADSLHASPRMGSPPRSLPIAKDTNAADGGLSRSPHGACILSPGRAVRAPALARHRRVKGDFDSPHGHPSVTTPSLRSPASLADQPALPCAGVRHSVAHPCGNRFSRSFQGSDACVRRVTTDGHPGLARSMDSTAQWIHSVPEGDLEIPLHIRNHRTDHY